MAPSKQPLFGGAIAVVLPGTSVWLDASDARPVPDHQEVFTEREAPHRAIIVEILERVDGEPGEVARAHFAELAASSGAKKAEMRECEVVRDALLHVPTACEVLRVAGTQLLEDGVRVGLSIAIVRLREQRSDVLLSISRAVDPSTRVGNASMGTQPHAPSASDAQELHLILRSLRILDWGLFNP